MSDKMTLFVVKQTKHVLGGVTVSADTDDVLGRAGVLVRFPKQTPLGGTQDRKPFQVLPDELEAVTTDLDLAVLLKPLAYVVDGGAPVPPDAAVPTLTLTAAEISVALAAAVDEDTNFWVQIDGGNLAAPRSFSGVIKKDEDTGKRTIESLEAGEYSVVALVAGYSMSSTEVSL